MAPMRAGPRVAVRGIGLVRILRFGGAALVQKDGQEHVGRHLEELRLPVLERGLGEVAGAEVLAHGERRFTVRAPLLVAGPLSHHDLPDEEDEKQQHHHDRQAVVAQDAPHGTRVALPPRAGQSRRSRTGHR
jgi:hypothetical protein